MKTGIDLIAQERTRQIEGEGYDFDRDKEYEEDQLALAGASYAIPPYRRDSFNIERMWPWDNGFWKPSPDNRIRELVKAGALIVADIDRLLELDKIKIRGLESEAKEAFFKVYPNEDGYSTRDIKRFTNGYIAGKTQNH